MSKKCLALHLEPIDYKSHKINSFINVSIVMHWNMLGNSSLMKYLIRLFSQAEDCQRKRNWGWTKDAIPFYQSRSHRAVWTKYDIFSYSLLFLIFLTGQWPTWWHYKTFLMVKSLYYINRFRLLSFVVHMLKMMCPFWTH